MTFLLASSVLLSNEKWSIFFDILNKKLMSAKSHVNKTQMSLTKTEKDMMNNLINGLHKRVIDIDQRPTIVDVINAEKMNSSPHTLPGEYSSKDHINDDYEVKNTEDELENNITKNDFKKLADEENASKDSTMTTADEVSSSIKHGYKDLQNDFVRCTNSKPVRCRNLKKTSKRPSSAKTSGKRKIRTKYSGVSRSSIGPLVLRFAKVINMLDRSDGVDEAIKTIGIPTALKNSAVLEVKCPFDKIVDEEALVKTILKKLKS